MTQGVGSACRHPSPGDRACVEGRDQRDRGAGGRLQRAAQRRLRQHLVVPGQPRRQVGRDAACACATGRVVYIAYALRMHCMCTACATCMCAACILHMRCDHAACAGGTRSTPTSRAAACPTRSARRSSAGTARCGERPWTRRTCSRRCGRGSQPSPRSFGRHVLRRPTPVPRRRASRASAASSTSAASRQHQWPMLWRAVRPPVLARAWHSVVAAAAEPREGVRYYVRSQEGETAPLERCSG